jgi:integrase/recombinase XerD
VSELIQLKISDLYFDEGLSRFGGKGNKERLIPIADSTIKYINIYKNEVRNHMAVHYEHSDILFLNRNGKQLTRAMIFTIIKQLNKRAGLNKQISPHTFRHSFANAPTGKRCRSSGHPDDAGSRKYHHHPKFIPI